MNMAKNYELKSNKARVCREIMDLYCIGLPAAAKRYNYVSCNGMFRITIEDIKRFYPYYD